MRAHFAAGTLALLGAALAAPEPVVSLAQGERPAAARRVVRVFDFEERLVNLEPVPAHWIRLVHAPPRSERPGYPRWNESGFDDRHAHSGAWSVKLPTRGGSAALRLASGVIPAIPGADYVVTAQVRTEGIVHSRAQLVARMVDSRGAAVAGTERRSELILAEEGWRPVSVELPGGNPESVWIQIDLELLQPEQLRRGQREPHEVVLEDMTGAAWFDDVMVQQLPRVTLSAGARSNVVIDPERPRLSISVRDLTGEELTATIVVRDIEGREEDRAVFAPIRSDRPIVWSPRVDRYGWRQAELVVSSDSGALARRRVDFVWSPAPRRAWHDESARFGVLVDDLHPSHRSAAPELIARLGGGTTHLSATALGLQGDGSGRISADAHELMESLLSGGQDVSITLMRSQDVEPSAHDGGFDLLFRPGASAGAFMMPFEGLVTRYGQRVRRWQFGAAGDDFGFWADDLVAGVARVRAALSRLAPEPIVAVPWRATHVIDPQVADVASLTITMPSGIAPEGIEAFAGLLQVADQVMVVETPSPALYGQPAAAMELVMRVVQTWRLQPGKLLIRQPWRAGLDEDPEALPTPQYAAMRQVIERLAGRRIVAELPVVDGAVALVLQGGGGQADAIVAWNERADPKQAVIRAYLADGPVTLIDPFGNATEVALQDGLHRIPITETPTFIEGVDVHLARFRAGVRIEPPFVHSSARRHEMELVIENPWPVAVSGTARISDPEHWRVSPRVQSFVIEPGQTARLAFEASFSLGEEAGPAPIGVDVELIADQRYPTIRLTPLVEIGLPNVQLSPSLRVDANGDLTVTLVVTNTGQRPLTAQIFAAAPGFAREQAPVSDLPPTRTIVKRFTFAGGGEALRGQSVRVGLIETEGLGRLNRTMRVE